MSRLIPSYIEQALRIEVLERAVIASEQDYERMRAAAQAAYRAMVAMELSDGSKREWDAAVDGLKAALAEPTVQESLNVAEPVGWLHWLTVDGERFPQLTLMPRTDKDEPLYTALPRREWVGLTDEDMADAHNSTSGDLMMRMAGFARAIEANLREKNA